MKNKAGIEIFSGFGIAYPEYEVITPQTKQSYTIRALNVSEEEALKGSMITPSKVARHLAEVLWKCIIKKPDNIKTFDDFITKNTMKDRDALLFGLYVSTYKGTQNFNVRCNNESCGFMNAVKIDIEKGLRVEFWDADEVVDKKTGNTKGSILDYVKTVPLEVFKGVNCLIKSPTMKDEIDVSESNNFTSDEVRNMQLSLTMVDKFTIDPNEKNPNGDQILDRGNIYDAYNTLTPADRKLIENAFDAEFNKYQIKIVSKVKCQKCGEMRDVEIDIAQQFFRSLFE